MRDGVPAVPGPVPRIGCPGRNSISDGTWGPTFHGIFNLHSFLLPIARPACPFSSPGNLSPSNTLSLGLKSQRSLEGSRG